MSQHEQDGKKPPGQPPSNQEFDELIKDGYKISVEATKHSNALPKGRDYDFYNAHETFKYLATSEGNRILGLINRILQRNEISGNVRHRSNDERTEMVLEANDAILERVAIGIDEMNGLRKTINEPVVQVVTAQLPVNGSWNRVDRVIPDAKPDKRGRAKAIQLMAGTNIVRPQIYFKEKVENSNNSPWYPRIREKPNSLKPLALYLEDTFQGEQFCHPYECELDRFEPPDEFLQLTDPPKPQILSETPLYVISTSEDLDWLVDELRPHREIAVDLEHHSYRSFMGITCLLQISTINADYIVDTLSLRDKCHVLNEIFTKGSIIKIFHGADCDIQWLQRDLSLYIVNMFDTQKAARYLEYSGLGLAFLLKRFCSFMPNKQFQLADWRIRPLPAELKQYAREDTHYLIYIYHMMKNELLRAANGKDNLLRAVFQAGTELCRTRYLKPRLTASSHLDFYRKSKRLFDNRQMYALREIYRWRDEIAREEDESTGYVLPNHMVLQISEMLPREIQGILACCNPIPPLVRANSVEIHKIILKAREQPVEKAIMKETNRKAAAKESIKLNIDNPLHCPHDIAGHQDFRDDLPTLLNNPLLNKALDLKKPVIIEKKNSIFSVFNKSDNQVDLIKRVASLKFLGPYERYKLVKPFVQEEEKKAQELKKTEEKQGDVDDDPSVEDRIASLHEHFVQVRKEVAHTQTPEDKTPLSYDPNRSLLEQGGSKKRKRDESVEPPVYSPRKAPKVQEVEPAEGYRPPKTKQEKKRKAKKRQENKKNERRAARQEEKFKPYDYSAVDYKQFQGGAGSATRGRVQTNFRGKNKPKNHGGGGRGDHNKSFTFENSNRGKSHRGGGFGGSNRGKSHRGRGTFGNSNHRGRGRDRGGGY